MQPNVYHTLRSDIHKFDIAAIGLHSRTNQIKHLLHARLQRATALRCGCRGAEGIGRM